MSAGCFAERLNDFITLSPNERHALARLEERERQYRRGTTVVRALDLSSELFIVRQGLAMSFVLLDDGSRQILRFLFPGDMFGGNSLVYPDAPESVVALSDCTVCPFERDALGELIVEHPRLAALIMIYNQIERVALTDRLAALGRTPAKARVAAILLEMRNRMRRRDRSVEDSFSLGLTQEEIGDATGLTSVHVNRMLRQLEDEGMIARQGGRFKILDEARLAKAANFVDRYSNLDLNWLPPAR